MKKISEIIEDLKNDPGFKRSLESGNLVEIWQQAAPEAVAAHTRPVRLLGEVLIVAVDTPVRAHRLLWEKQKLIAAFNRYSVRKIKTIRFQPLGLNPPPAP